VEDDVANRLAERRPAGLAGRYNLLTLLAEPVRE
jgi:hypothetical protein